MPSGMITATVFSDLVFESDMTRRKLERYANGELRGNLILHGPYGSGKSTAAEVIAEQSRPRDREGIDRRITKFRGNEFPLNGDTIIANIWDQSVDSFQYAIIDEFDLMERKRVEKVRALIDKFRGEYGIILTTNHLRRISPAIQSHCTIVEIEAPSPKTLLPICRRILVQEGVSMQDNEILIAIKNTGGNIRKVEAQMALTIHHIKAINSGKTKTINNGKSHP